MKTLLSLALTTVLISASSVWAKDDVRDSVVKIHVTQRSPNYVRPWTKSSVSKISGSGVVIAGNRILTNAHVVQYASRIQVQPNQSTEKLSARVIAIAIGIDLAVITVDDKDFFKKRKAIPLGENIPKIKDSLSTYGYPVGGEQQSVTEGIVSRIEYASFILGTSGLRIQVDAALNPGNSGGPAIAKGKIIGLCFSIIKSANNIGYLIAVDEIKTFLNDIKDGSYTGKPKIFDQLQTVENEALRKRLGLKSADGGLMVKSPYSKAKDYPVQPWDVITHIGKHKLDKQGFGRVSDLRLRYSYFVTKEAKKGKVPITFLRKGKSMKGSLPVMVRSNSLIPYLRGKYPRHFIYGPMLFTAANQDLMLRLPGSLKTILSSRQSPLTRRQFARKAFAGEELVILGARMFPHKTSEGYDAQTFAVVTHINKVKVKNLAHLVELFRDAKGEYLVIRLGGSYEDLVFNREELSEATEEILENEGIRKQYSKDLAAIWKKKKKK